MHTCHLFTNESSPLCRDAAMAARQELAAPQSGSAAGAGGLQSPEHAFAGYAQLQQRAQHHGFAAALAGSAPAFPGTAQLAQRWVAAHMLSNQARPPCGLGR